MNRIMSIIKNLFTKKDTTKANISVTEHFGMIVKGNINKKGERIAHLPGGRFYDVVKPVETFDSIEKAEEAGYRLSKQ